MTNTKTALPVITYVNPDAPRDVQLHTTPYDPPEGRVVWVVLHQNELLRLPLAVLVQAYNLATGKSIKAFHTRAKGAVQTYSALQQWVQAQPIAASRPSAPPAKRAGGRPARFSPDMKVRVLVKGNPRRRSSDSWRRFNLYRTGMTVAEALEAGLSLTDLRWDHRAKFIEVK